MDLSGMGEAVSHFFIQVVIAQLSVGALDDFVTNSASVVVSMGLR